jgi:hypothetical protein
MLGVRRLFLEIAFLPDNDHNIGLPIYIFRKRNFRLSFEKWTSDEKINETFKDPGFANHGKTHHTLLFMFYQFSIFITLKLNKMTSANIFLNNFFEKWIF